MQTCTVHTMSMVSQVVTVANYTTFAEVACRNQAKQLAQCLQNKNAAGAQKLLSSDKSLIWSRDDDSGGYPLHIAVYHVSCNALSKPALEITLECCLQSHWFVLVDSNNIGFVA